MGNAISNYRTKRSLNKIRKQHDVQNYDLTANPTFTRVALQNKNDYDDIPFFSYKGEKDLCLVSKCYDGDTIHIVRLIRKKPYRFNCRLLGIDTAEIRSNDKEEKAFAIKTRDFLAELILHKKVWVEFDEYDKYGRVLCNIYLSKRDLRKKHSLNDRLVKEGYAYSYDGSTKLEFSEWKNFKDKNLHQSNE